MQLAETHYSTISYTMNLHLKHLELNLSLHSEKPTSNCLSYGMATLNPRLYTQCPQLAKERKHFQLVL
jgi:hypothetical protein